MELLITNSGKAKSVIRNGREYLNVPASLIVPGVLAGSNGPLYYSPEQTAQGVERWNGTPITMYHPTVNGQYVSASHKSVIRYGWLEKATFNGKLTAQAWIDVQRMMKHPEGPDTVRKLRAGEHVELSTGLFTQNIDRAGVDPKSGRRYTQLATNFTPDHLAILPNQVGACSLQDGCGLNVNAKGSCCDACAKSSGGKPTMKCPTCKGSMTANKKGVYTCNNAECDTKTKAGKKPVTNKSPEPAPKEELTVMKTKLVKWLTANCDVWKGKEMILNKLTEAELKGLRKQAMAASEANEVLTTVKDTLGITDLTANTLTAELKKATAKAEPPKKQPKNIVTNGKKKPYSRNMDDVEAEEEEEPMPKKKPVANAEDEDLMDEYRQVVNERRQELANAIVDRLPLRDEDARRKKYKTLLKMTTNQLREELDMLAEQKKRKVTANADDDDGDDLPGYRPSRAGANGNPTANSGRTESRLEPIPQESIDWSELSAFQRG